MRMALRSALPLVLAAAAFALARSEGAAPLPATADVDVEANDDTPALPRVLPPQKTPPAAVRPAPSAAPVIAAVGRPGVLATTAAPPAVPAVDLLAQPALPVQWSQPAARPATAATLGRPAPAGYPAALAPVPIAAHTAPAPMTAKAVLAPPPALVKQAVVAAPAPAREAVVAAAPPAKQAVAAVPVVSRPTLTPLPAQPPAPPKRVWPPAFVTRDVADGEMKPAAYSEKAKAPEPTAAPGGAAVDDLRQRVLVICGHDATGVTVSKQPDGFVVVRVRLREAGAEQKVIEKVLKMPEMTRPTVRLVLDPGT